MHKNQNDSDVFIRVVTNFILPVVFVGYATYFFAIPTKTLRDYLIASGAFLLGIIIVANQKSINKQYVSILLWFKNSQAIYGYIKIKLEYLDDLGDRVSLKREDYVSNVSAKKREFLEPIPVEADGDFRKSETTAVNGFVSFPSNKRLLFHCDEKNIIHNGVSYYSCVMSNAFKNKTEYFVFFVKNYCKFYQLEVVIPRSRAIIDVKLLVRERIEEHNDLASINPIINVPNSNGWKQVNGSRILKIHSYSNSTIQVYIDGMHTENEYKLEWTLD